MLAGYRLGLRAWDWGCSMKKGAIRTAVNDELARLGYGSNQYRWFGSEVHVVIGGGFRTFKFPAGKARYVTARELGRLIGWHEALAPAMAPRSATARLENGAIHAIG